MLAELRQAIPALHGYKADALENMEPEAMVAALVEWADRHYWTISQQFGETTYHTMRQEETSLKTLAETQDPFTRVLLERVNATVGREILDQWYDQPIRRMPKEIEAQVKNAVIDVTRLFRDRRLMLQQLDNHWVRHLTGLDMLREGIGLRAIGQQKPLVSYQREAYEAYQEMLESVQKQIVRSLFAIPQQSARSHRSRRPTVTARRPVFRASGGSSQGSAKPQPVRVNPARQKLGRNDPCWCGSGRKYKDCHWRSDKRQGKG
jgi:preprotein translocase subunit SecA